MVSNRECTCGFGKQSSLTFKSPYFWLHKELLISLKLPLLSRQSRNYTHTFQSECARGVCAHTFCSFVSPKTFILFTHLPLFLHNPGVFFSQQQSSFLFISWWITLFCVSLAAMPHSCIYVCAHPRNCGERVDVENKFPTLKKIKTNIILGFYNN